MDVKLKIDGEILKFVRDSLGLTQVEFAPLVGRKYSAIQGYERGTRVPAEVQQRVRQLASERGIALPASEGIDSEVPMEYSTSTPGSPPSTWHQLLDEVLSSGVDDAITAVQRNLIVSSRYIRSQTAGRLRRKGT